MTLLKKNLSTLLVVLLAALTPVVASAGTITTLFAQNNNGSAGGAVYFDITIGPLPISITGFDINTNAPGSFGFSVYTTASTAVGNQLTPGAWTLVASGTGTGAGVNNASPVVLNDPFSLSAGTSYGMALVIGSEGSHQYTNGTGGNQNYSNADLALAFGSATNVPFTSGVFTPRVWNGTIYYDTAGDVPEPGTIVLCMAGLLALALLRRS